MRALSGLSFLLGLVFFGDGAVFGSQQWTNSEGKTITASFVRLSPTGSSVIIQQDGKTFEVELSRLNAESQKQALSLQERKTEWAAQEALRPLLSEEVLIELVQFSQPALVGKHYLVEGRVAKILTSGSLSSTQPRIQLAGGTVSMTDFTSYGLPGSSKLRISSDRVTLLSVNKSTGLRSYGETDLLRAGQLVAIQVRVDRHEVAGLGFADPVELRAAQGGPAARTFEEYLSDWSNAMTMPFTNRPTLSSSSSPTPATAPPSTSPQNSLLQWLMSLLGQSETKPSEAP